MGFHRFDVQAVRGLLRYTISVDGATFYRIGENGSAMGIPFRSINNVAGERLHNML